ncbi:hypothetical protein, partial [Mesorhizobium sp. M7A.F.Ca.US.006.04.2.1]|uniref:hypothetical protein n=1 Tax=Mesorhizobium sp. M7A.F.Ca.US.006.04.2.1 TaxID=2496696 RepID=UPI001FDEB9A5
IQLPGFKQCHVVGGSGTAFREGVNTAPHLAHKLLGSLARLLERYVAISPDADPSALSPHVALDNKRFCPGSDDHAEASQVSAPPVLLAGRYEGQ